LFRIEFRRSAEDDYLYWVKHNQNMVDRIDELLSDMKLDPTKGKGNPKPLKDNLQGYWSRRITQKHRIVYKITGDLIVVYFCRGHYE